MDAGHYETAEKWYEAALLKKPDDVRVLDGLCVVYLEQGKAKDAEEAISKLAKADPTNQDLTQFRERLAKVKSGGDKSK
jgi:Flp pilus assembly protein TadD